MTKEEQRIAIAEYCGLQQCCIRCEHEQNISLNKCVECGASTETKRTTPDYLNDLNAIHEAESRLNRDGRIHYIQILVDIGKKESVNSPPQFFHAIIATASQRSEAFLRTIGKWVE